MPLENYGAFQRALLNEDLVGSLAATGTKDPNEIRLIEGIRGAKAGHDEATTEGMKGGYINEGRQYFAALSKYQKMPQQEKEKREYYPQVTLDRVEGERRPDLMKIKTKTDKSGEKTRYASFTEFKSNEHDPEQRKHMLQMLKIPESIRGTAESPMQGSASNALTKGYKTFWFGEGGATVTRFKTVFAGHNPRMDEPKETAPLVESRPDGTFIKSWTATTRVMNVAAKHR